MATRLVEMSLDEFGARLEALGYPCPRSLIEALYGHYRELRRWAARLALVGARDGDVILERHYAESLAAVPFLDEASAVVDLGSGAGFPGLVLAAARPEAEFWLFESRGRKAAFLRAASARAGLSCRTVDARVSRRQPVTTAVPEKTIDLVTIRGMKIDPDVWQGVKPALASNARILRWEGEAAVEPWPDAVPGRSARLPGRGRKIQEWRYRGEAPR